MFVSFVGEEVGSNHETRQRDLPHAARPGFTEGLRSASGPPAEPHHTAARAPRAILSTTTAILALVPRGLAARGETLGGAVPAQCLPSAPCSWPPPLPPHGIPSSRDPLRQTNTLVRETRDTRRWCFASASAVPLRFRSRSRSLDPMYGACWKASQDSTLTTASIRFVLKFEEHLTSSTSNALLSMKEDRP
ncbi:hypothetical protein NDU88_006388 [Pleurodeles waltl]|uniref:Uncharacterized protein n=1 Tax=Pleurodeles waltl TaxID=8319 RepID=A0AAV7NQ44_PLEWA|nr:hypothetical protein NDU88_006388 [Pleurodeles waltl]